MAEKFNPAPKDKHAADPKKAQKADKEMHDKLDKGLEGTFPASDPVSSAQPAKISQTPANRMRRRCVSLCARRRAPPANVVRSDHQREFIKDANG
jgi:hypothetical protein